MAWTAPLTAVANATLTAAQWNATCRDNFMLMEPAKATAANTYQGAKCLMMTSGTANQITEREAAHAIVARSEATSSTSYTSLRTTGPSVTASTGTNALVFWGCQLENSSLDVLSTASVAVSGATTIAASDTYAIRIDGVTAANPQRLFQFHQFTTLTAGSNVFTVQYRVSGGTGTFNYRDIAVLAL